MTSVHEVKRFVIPVLEYLGFIHPHRLKISVWYDEADCTYSLKKKRVYEDGLEQARYEWNVTDTKLSQDEYLDRLSTILSSLCLQEPNPRLPKVTEYDRKWMKFEID